MPARPAVSEAWRNAKGWNDENGSIDCITVLASVIAVVGAEAQIAVGGSASLIAGAYLAGTKTRRVRRALSAVFGGGQQRYGEPRVADGERRLGRLERGFAGRGAINHPSDPGWRRYAGPA